MIPYLGGRFNLIFSIKTGRMTDVAKTATEDDLLDAYQRLTRQDIQAALTYRAKPV